MSQDNLATNKDQVDHPKGPGAPRSSDKHPDDHEGTRPGDDPSDQAKSDEFSEQMGSDGRKLSDKERQVEYPTHSSAEEDRS